MTIRRNKLKPDTRPKWNDDLTISYMGKEYTFEEWQKMCAHALVFDLATNYKNDPTYNLKKQKVKE